MAKINVNLTNVGQENLPDGDYFLIVTEGTKIRKTSTGSLTIGWACKVTDGEFEGQRAYFETSLAEAALWKVKEIVDAMGLAWDEDGFDLEDSFDLEFQAHLYNEEFNDRMFQKASDFKPIAAKASTKKK